MEFCEIVYSATFCPEESHPLAGRKYIGESVGRKSKFPLPGDVLNERRIYYEKIGRLGVKSSDSKKDRVWPTGLVTFLRDHGPGAFEWNVEEVLYTNDCAEAREWSQDGAVVRYLVVTRLIFRASQF